MTLEDHPAMIAARKSWAAVHAHDKEAWLRAMADNIVIEDPIGESITNPTGLGARGKAEVSDFWDANIGPNKIAIDVHLSRAAGSESAHHMTLTTTFDGGTTAIVTGLFAYTVDDEGLLTSLRGWWSLDDVVMEEAHDTANES